MSSSVPRARSSQARLAGLAVVLLGLVAFELPTRMKLPAGTDIAAALLLGAASFAGGLWAAAQWQAPLF